MYPHITCIIMTLYHYITAHTLLSQPPHGLMITMTGLTQLAVINVADYSLMELSVLLLVRNVFFCVAHKCRAMLEVCSSRMRFHYYQHEVQI